MLIPTDIFYPDISKSGTDYKSLGTRIKSKNQPVLQYASTRKYLMLFKQAVLPYLAVSHHPKRIPKN